MHTLKFKSKQFARMMKWMRTHERKIPYVDETTDDYGVWLVKDHGIYLMAASAERDMDDDKHTHVIYAQGYSPEVGDDLWDKNKLELQKVIVEKLEIDYPNISQYIEYIETGTASTVQEYIKTPIDVSYHYCHLQ